MPTIGYQQLKDYQFFNPACTHGSYNFFNMYIHRHDTYDTIPNIYLVINIYGLSKQSSKTNSCKKML